MVFEGEYLNGKRWNGKGKEYNNYGELIFEGEYLNGKCFECNIDGYLIFEGEYLNDKRNGKGKEYDHYGKLIFEGEYLKGKRYNGNEYDLVSNIICPIINGKRFIDLFESEESMSNEEDSENDDISDEEYSDSTNEEPFLFPETMFNYLGEFKDGKKHGKGM